MNRPLKALCISLVQAAGIVGVVQLVASHNRPAIANPECDYLKFHTHACELPDLAPDCPYCSNITAWGYEYSNIDQVIAASGETHKIVYPGCYDVPCYFYRQCLATFAENGQCIGETACDGNPNTTCPTWELVNTDWVMVPHCNMRLCEEES